MIAAKKKLSEKWDDTDYKFEINESLQKIKTILLDLSVDLGLKRVASRRTADRLERESRIFHSKVKNGFLELARKNKKRFIVIKADSEVSKIQNKIQNEVLKVLANGKSINKK